MFPADFISGSHDFTQHLTSGELILIHSADACILVQIARARTAKNPFEPAQYKLQELLFKFPLASIFTISGVEIRVGAVIRNTEQYDPVKIKPTELEASSRYYVLKYRQDPARVLIGQKPTFYQSIKHRKSVFYCFTLVKSIF